MYFHTPGLAQVPPVCDLFPNLIAATSFPCVLTVRCTHLYGSRDTRRNAFTYNYITLHALNTGWMSGYTLIGFFGVCFVLFCFLQLRKKSVSILYLKVF